jgi:hypothetical protein
MSEAVPQDLKGTVAFTRKVSDGNYGTVEGFMSVQFDITDNAEAVIESARAAFLQAKAVVFEQLGIEHTLDESGVVVEQVRRAIPGTVVEPASAHATAPAGDVAENPPHDPKTTDADAKAANKEWALARYAAFPGEFYDNRPKKASGEYKANSPDIKHKASGLGVWL